MAERSAFDDLIAFFYLDLTRGLPQGICPAGAGELRTLVRGRGRV